MTTTDDGMVQVKSTTLKMKPDHLPAFVELVASALGGHQMSAGVSEDFNHYKFKMGGKDLELYVRSRSSGEVTLAFPEATADEDVAMVLNAIKAVKTLIYVGNVGVSLGFRRLHEPLHARAWRTHRLELGRLRGGG